jgi:PTS system galactitol-specific IIA component
MSDTAAFGLATGEALILIAPPADDAAGVIGALADQAVAAGLADHRFKPAVLARESEYPTGLPTAVPLAIPHIHDGCLTSFLACAVPAAPVRFKSMEGDDSDIDARLVFLFGITDPKAQARVLRQLSVLFQDAACLDQLAAAATPAQVLEILRSRLGQGLVELPPTANTAKERKQP